uniref:Uncharacterized protein n=1 Tax=Oryza meridionalis TaxID=40149 RepID=A0A0E0DYR9_9ORYZ
MCWRCRYDPPGL